MTICDLDMDIFGYRVESRGRFCHDLKGVQICIHTNVHLSAYARSFLFSSHVSSPTPVHAILSKPIRFVYLDLCYGSYLCNLLS